nr:TBP associated factor 1C [Hymenolepis microstoma]
MLHLAWDIHTHHSNHHNKFNFFRDPHGHGRCTVADWGRLGFCLMDHEDSKLQVYSQYSTDLAGALYHVKCPQPVMPVHYFHCQGQIDYPRSFARLFKDLGISSLIKDPVLSESACSAYICSKFISILKKNFPNLPFHSEEKLKSNLLESETTNKFLKSVEELSEKALEEKCSEESIKRFLGIMADADNLENQSSRRTIGKKSLRSSSHPKPKLPLTETMSAIFDIPQSGEKSISCFMEDVFGDSAKPSDSSNFSSALDPFIISLSARPVNPVYLGSGCLQLIGDANPLLIWSPTVSRSNLVSSVPRIFVAPFSNDVSFPLSSEAYATFELPDSFRGSAACEIEAVQLSDTSFYSVVRTTDGGVSNSRVDFKSPCESEPSFSIFKIRHINFPPGSSFGYRPTSVAIGPWRIHRNYSSVRSLEYALAGRIYDPSHHSTSHLAVIDQFDAINNKKFWSTRVPLDCEGECITHHLTNSTAASSSDFAFNNLAEYEFEKNSYPSTFLSDSLLAYCNQMEQPGSDEKSRLLPREVLLRTELDLQLSHVSSWVRVGFADAPGMFSLTTPKRLLHFDSRVPNRPVQELFNLTKKTVDLRGGRLFNPHETFFHAQPQWYNDTYALLPTDYSVLVVDKRMPNHTVLKFSHALRGPPTYAKFVDMEKLDSFPAQTALVMASQFPGEISLTGINFNLDQDIPPQGVGPSMTHGHLITLLDCPLNRIPGGSVDPHFCDERLNGGIIGCTTRVLTDRAITGIILTTQGDVFTEDWYFNKIDAQNSHRERSNSIRLWCMGFQSCEKESQTQIDDYPEEIHQPSNKTEEIPTSVDEDRNPGNDEEVTQEFDKEASELTGTLLESVSEQFTFCALTEGREDQEKTFETYLMDILEGGMAELYPRDYLPYFRYRDDYYEGLEGNDDDGDNTDVDYSDE